jgi:hypothetical protein
VHPVHALLCVLHTGVAPEHALAFVAVQGTHWFVVALHAGVDPLHPLSSAQGSHFPLFGPLMTHAPARHCGVLAQVPSPRPTPHAWSIASHAPLLHTLLALPALHAPSPFA